MARIHIDLHFISSDNIEVALALLLSSGLISRSERDIRFCDLNKVKRQYPEIGAFIEVKSIY